MNLDLLHLLCCPDCHGELLHNSEALVCQGCQKTFPIKDGIPCFTAGTDVFYEGKFVSTRKSFENAPTKFLYDVYTAISVDSSLDRFLNSILRNRRGLTILDLGCGGGREYLCQAGSVVGVDISMQSLAQAKGVYAMAVGGDAYQLPFRDNSFDLVCSFDLIGHIPLECKSRLLFEINRVTKEGGLTAHNIECASDGVLFRWARKYPGLYQKYFVEMYGHHGLEYPRAVFRRFRSAGFAPVVENADACKSLIRPIHSYAVFFDNEFKKKSRAVSLLAAVSRVFLKHTPLRLMGNCLMGCLVPLAHFLIPVDNRDAVMVLYRKESGARTVSRMK